MSEEVRFRIRISRAPLSGRCRLKIDRDHMFMATDREEEDHLMRRLHYIISIALVIVLAVGGSSVAAPGEYFGTDYDLGGATVRFQSWGEGAADRFKPGGAAEGRLEEAEKLFNCKITFEAHASWDAISDAYMARLMSGDSEYDIWDVQNLIAFYDVAPAGALFPMNEIYAQYPDLTISRLTKTLSHKGNLYILQVGPAVDEEPDRIDTGLNGIYFNKQIFEAEGLPDPYELYEAGQWNWETFTEILKKATRDTDGDGAIDQWGMTIPNVEYFIMANGAQVVTTDETGRAVLGLKDPKAERAVMQLYQWINVDKVVGYEWMTAFSSGKYAMSQMAIWMIYGAKDVAEFEWGFVPLPKGPDADRYYYPAHAVGGKVLPANSANPEALLALYSYLYYDEPGTGEQETRSWISWAFYDRESVEIAWEAARTWDGEVVMPSAYHKVFTDYITPALNGIMWEGKSYAASIEAIEGPVQVLLDELLN